MKNSFLLIFGLLLGGLSLYLYIANPLERMYNVHHLTKLLYFGFFPVSITIQLLFAKHRFHQRLFATLLMLFWGGYYFFITPDNLKTLGISLGAVLLAGALVTFFWLKYKAKTTTKEE